MCDHPHCSRGFGGEVTSYEVMEDHRMVAVILCERHSEPIERLMSYGTTITRRRKSFEQSMDSMRSSVDPS